jgi:DNA (cytosine-5)-methyltransferase 1
MRILNLYCGLGGNRRLWGDVLDITAVELQPDIAEFYTDQYPDDTVIVGDAHTYLLEHYQEFDFIWASPPCPTHSRARFWRHSKSNPVYPEMSLYQEILLLQHHFDGLWLVENVKPYYDPLIQPTLSLGRHHFWSNFYISHFHATDADIQGGTREEWQKVHGIEISGYKFNDRTDKILRNCVHPELGRHIFDCARGVPTALEQASLF